MFIQKTILEPNAKGHYEIPGLFWPEFFNILLNIALPLIFYIALIYVIIKFYRIFKRMNQTLSEINKNIENQEKEN